MPDSGEADMFFNPLDDRPVMTSRLAPTGVPIDKDVGLVYPDEYGKKVGMLHTPRVRVFDLSKPEDLKDYQQVYQDACDGKVYLGLEDLRFSEKTNSWLAFLRWYRLRIGQLKRNRDGSGNDNGNGQSVYR